VLHSSGERKRVLDIKRGGLLPIDVLARWSGLEHQIERLRAGRPPDDLIDPRTLTPLTRTGAEGRLPSGRAGSARASRCGSVARALTRCSGRVDGVGLARGPQH
jgi:hypothetical protein